MACFVIVKRLYEDTDLNMSMRKRTGRLLKSSFLPFAVRSEYHQLYKLNSTRNLNMKKTGVITQHRISSSHDTNFNTLLHYKHFSTQDKSFSRATVGQTVYLHNR